MLHWSFLSFKGETKFSVMLSVHPVIVPAETATTEHILVSLQGTVFDCTPMIDDVQDTVWSNFNILLVIILLTLPLYNL